MFQPWPGGLTNTAELEPEQVPKQLADNLIFGTLRTIAKPLSESQDSVETFANDNPGDEKKSDAPKTYEVKEIIGLTRVEQEKYFLVGFTSGANPLFIRTTLANKMFPDLVIDFYLKQVRWKSSPESPSS